MKHSASEASLSLKAVNRERQRSADSEKEHKKRERLFFLLGTVALILVVLLWSFSSYLTRVMLTEDYGQPFIITVASCLSFQVYFIFLILPDPLIYVLQQKQQLDESRQETAKEEEIMSSAASTVSKNSKASTKLPPLTLTQTARISFVFFCLYFLSNFLLNFALGGGPVGKISNLVSTSGFFTLLIGYFWKVEEMSVLRVIAVMLSLLATVLSIIRGFSFSGEVTRACLFALSSAVAYGCYSIYLKVVTKDESRVSMPILFAFVGFYTMVLIVPAAVIVHVTGFNTFPTPTAKTALNILINAVVGGLFPNYMWNVAFAFTTPLIVAIGLSFSTPLGLFTSWILKETINFEDYIAAVVVVLSFAVLNLASLNKRLDKEINHTFLALFSKPEESKKTEKKCCGCTPEIKLNSCNVNSNDKQVTVSV